MTLLHWTIRPVLVLLLASTSISASATALVGRVVGIADGDTLTVLVDGNHQVKVRLAEIDAPEKSQPFGTKSKQSLSELCFGTTAELVVQAKDRYGRTVARVRCSGIDANAEQIRRGLAWVYDRYANDHALYQLQDVARATKAGLWSDPDPVPPWEWRKQSRSRGR